MNPQKSSEEVMYDAITDLFRMIQGPPSMAKLEQAKRTSDLFSKAIDRVAEKACIAVFERLQERVHNAFKSMEKDMTALESRVDTLSEELNKLDRLFKSAGK